MDSHCFLCIAMIFQSNSKEFYAFLLQASYGHSYCIPIAFLWAFLPLFVIIVASDVIIVAPDAPPTR